MNLEAAKTEYPEAFMAIERRIAEWQGELNDPPVVRMIDAQVIAHDGYALLAVVAQADFGEGFECIQFRAPLNASEVTH
ncbi:hypothetical protein [Dokdonella immobilis]|uniref:Uncharacterized protein n=1 Tax=Dokdonella immobilis TaxID=578942 RepID=A0A1I4ZUF8_9GAMM|nr:hypothetical protein [Dokdonella immobilis]SFN53797.1 hypothetical protein SAMN05216289_1299 [Dokdonella immobilis]